MPRKSSVKTLLPDADLDELDKKIGSGKFTLDELVEWLEARGYRISRSALHRHGVEVQRVAERMQQLDRVTEALGRNMSDAAIEGKQGRLLVKMVRDLLFEFIMKVEDGEALSPKDFAMLGKAMAELGRSQRLSQDFETKIREQAKQEAREEAAKKLDGAVEEAVAAGEKGLSAERAKQLRREILGVRN